jgi:hypothetical protein
VLGKIKMANCPIQTEYDAIDPNRTDPIEKAKIPLWNDTLTGSFAPGQDLDDWERSHGPDVADYVKHKRPDLSCD